MAGAPRSRHSCCSILNTLPALLAVGITALARQAGAADLLDEANPIRHDTYWSLTSTLVMLFCAAQAPELFGRDQRYGVLPLYFSRVLTRVDYALARAGGLFIAILIMTVVPQLVLTIGAILAAADPLTGLGKELPEIPRYLTVCVLGSGVFAGVSAVVASCTPRRAYSRRGDHRGVHRAAHRGGHHRRVVGSAMSPGSSSSRARVTSSMG